MFVLIRNVGTSIQGALQLSPSRRFRTELGRRAGFGVAISGLLGIGYLLVAAVFQVLLERGGPGWLHLLVILFIWNGLTLCWQAVFGTAGSVSARLRRRRP
ncbi:hypothetical protein [Jiangella mangrovi]|uniref:Uncharacterized protein n=1 Tax=Jiangella mangrovi TaxID=1524084 RepID=A0A7W9LM01_9ACTN|nr:hypothetical protein [Jiangella mangrovi]MBB5788755.1 hypothetical protein [Jiangella mangrovi]